MSNTVIVENPEGVKKSGRSVPPLLLISVILIAVLASLVWAERHSGRQEMALSFVRFGFDASSRMQSARNKEVYLRRPAPGELFATIGVLGEDLKISIYDGIGVKELRLGAGHLIETVLPGETGNCVISGYLETTFANIQKIKPGDRLFVETLVGAFTYEVIESRVAKAGVDEIIKETQLPTITLAAANPLPAVGKAAEAYLVVALLIDPPPALDIGQRIRRQVVLLMDDRPLRVIAAANGLSLPISKPRIVIEESKFTLTFFSGDIPLKVYPVAIGKYSLEGGKSVDGDARTPVGEYYICKKVTAESLTNPLLGSCWMMVSYPNTTDANNALEDMRISLKERNLIAAATKAKAIPPQSTALGGGIGIHGGYFGSESTSTRIWSGGCIGMRNADAEDVYRNSPKGTLISIRP